ncbi:MAG TPA: VOC family protein [Acidimicrobiales bacterium]|nr:VOC family protein [Acidimicrobiales bacterium]
MLLRNITFMTRDPERLADFWAAALELPGRHRPNEDEVIVHDGDWGFPRITFQRVDDGAARTPSPIHLDLTPEDRLATIERLKSLGATEGDTHGDDDFRWTVLRDPDGNELCVTDGGD